MTTYTRVYFDRAYELAAAYVATRIDSGDAPDVMYRLSYADCRVLNIRDESEEVVVDKLLTGWFIPGRGYECDRPVVVLEDGAILRGFPGFGIQLRLTDRHRFKGWRWSYFAKLSPVYPYKGINLATAKLLIDTLEEHP